MAASACSESKILVLNDASSARGLVTSGTHGLGFKSFSNILRSSSQHCVLDLPRDEGRISDNSLLNLHNFMRGETQKNFLVNGYKAS